MSLLRENVAIFIKLALEFLSMLSKHQISVLLFLTTLVLGITACDTRLLDLPVLPGTSSEKDRPRVEVSCSKTIPSTAVVMLTWRFHAQLDDRYRVDLTVYSDGFAQDRYASFWPLKSGQQPEALAVSKLRKRPLEPILLPRLKSISQDLRQGSTTVRLEGMAGGLVYQFRLVTLKGQGWLPGSAVRVEAPVCITEHFNETGEP